MNALSLAPLFIANVLAQRNFAFHEISRGPANLFIIFIN
jgi:hypothetical protein